MEHFSKYLAERSGPDGEPKDILAAMPESELNLRLRLLFLQLPSYY